MSERIPTEEETLRDHLREIQEEYWKQSEPILKRLAEIQAEKGIDRPFFGRSVLDNPEYKKAQRELNEMYRGMVDTLAGNPSAVFGIRPGGSKIYFVQVPSVSALHLLMTERLAA